MVKHTQSPGTKQAAGTYSAYVSDRCQQFLAPLLEQLNGLLDRRLVRTFLQLVLVILTHRHRQQGLVLSELGGHLLAPAQAPAGTKRLSHLLRSPRWSAALLREYLWAQADQRVAALRQASERVLAIWDESVLEKPESLALAGLCPVRSAKAARLKRIKPGFFNPPGGRPIMVPGWHWLQVLVLGMQGAPVVAHMRWWSSRGAQASDRRSQEQAVLTAVAERWRAQVLHIWDRGFAGGP